MAVQQITISDLQTIMRQCAGETEDALPLEQALDRPFDELGYDSLALLETHSRLERDYGIKLSEDEVGEINTAQELVDFVNALLRSKVIPAA